jgi:ubiquinone/menaquinone biosynthesis C-methylase UbiE
MNIEEAYNNWAHQYDTNINRTRDLEAFALREMLADKEFDHCLELGCGTGKNTQWLVEKAQRVTSIDFSDEMLKKAKARINSPKVDFVKADINQTWDFAEVKFDLVTFSLVLEHIENLDLIFMKLSEITHSGSLVYIGELHPFKQYMGTKARYETETGVQEVTCFIHHISDFIQPALKYGFEIIDLREFFDEDNMQNVPRILSFLLCKRFI